jgi:hypothetical protein
LTGVQAPAQSDEPVFHADSNFQPIAVQVIDKQGKYVQGLTAEDFTILEDDEPRRIVLFGGAEQPVDPCARPGSSTASHAQRKG